MIIQEIRLKNIKSYGTGPNGDGVKIQFQPGINYIGGHNGSGKSTIIEAIGYALFNAKPQYLENYDLNTYFLKNGTKVGEIEIVFTHKELSYKVERYIGNSKKRSKIISILDQNICAEDEFETNNFLCKLFNFNNSNYLSDIFTKLIGITQGHIGRPFDSKASHAKDFFEPLFDVDIFQHCFDKIKFVINHIDLQITEQKKLIAIEEERLKERSDAIDIVNSQNIIIDNIEQQINILSNELSVLNINKNIMEEQYDSLTTATSKCDDFLHKADIAIQKRIYAYKQVINSQAAINAIKKLTANYKLFLKAEYNINQLQILLKCKQNLEKKYDLLNNKKIELNSRLQFTYDQIAVLDKQIFKKKTELIQIEYECCQHNNNLIDTNTILSKENVVKYAEQAMQVLQRFFLDLPNMIKNQLELLTRAQKLQVDIFLNENINSRLESKRNKENAFKVKLQESTNSLIALQERSTIFKKQIQKITIGICPLMNETCKQFNKVQIINELCAIDEQICKYNISINNIENILLQISNQLKSLELAKIQHDKQHEEFQNILYQLKTYTKHLISNNDILLQINLIKRYIKDIPDFAVDIMQDIDDLSLIKIKLLKFQDLYQEWFLNCKNITTRFIETETKHIKTMIENNSLMNYKTNFLIKLNTEIESLYNLKSIEQIKVNKINQIVANCSNRLALYKKKLAAFINIDNELSLQADIINSNKISYIRYLELQPLAKQMPILKATLQCCINKERIAKKNIIDINKALCAINLAFNKLKFEETKQAVLIKTNQLAIYSTQLEYAKDLLKKEEKRYLEWTISNKKKEHIAKKICHLKSAIDIGELARRILRQTAPFVAQRICNEISVKAQKIFNLIHDDPIVLEWNANRYSLRINPGERRFSMLSGGEQTKLAISITLAMIQILTNIKFCIFDEPTYGVDAKSRDQLANAIIFAQRAISVDQMLIVSHDNSFNSKIDHSILLLKSAQLGGTYVKATY